MLRVFAMGVFNEDSRLLGGMGVLCVKACGWERLKRNGIRQML